ncbi:MAG: ABC transporter ATP-binding protein [Clostridiaceae bacterium]|nr:ABC transporter ATP-binding protein [Clostridiaceae bacterium]
MANIIEVKNLRKTYGKTIAVTDVSFVVHEGEIFGMVGPNGAGKTTTIECIEGLRKPDQGSIRVLGVDPQMDRHTLCSYTGMQLQQSSLPDHMKVWEALDLYSSFYPHPIDYNLLIEQLGLTGKRDAQFKNLSGGQKQRLFIALAILPNPKLVFLDELTTGLDPQARHAIWDLIREIRAQGKTILLTTHFMEEAERLCDHVAIIDNGQIVAIDTPQNLIHSLAVDERVSFSIYGKLLQEWQEPFAKIGKMDVQGERITIQGQSTDTMQLVVAVVNQLSTLKIPFHDLRTEQPTLEDVFLNLTGHQIRE